MISDTREKLLAINRKFYDQFAGSFSATRHQVQPGVHQMVHQMIQSETILDVGCGNGTLARMLAAEGFQGSYLGLDMSKDLLTSAEDLFEAPSKGTFNFMPFDLADREWHQSLPGNSYDWLACFAVLHHIPGEELRTQTGRNFASLVPNTGRVALSVWQWQNSPRLKKRVVPWSTVNVDPEDLDEGDVLLDWRAGKTIGYRYVHTFTEDSLSILAKEAGFKVIESFYSDGKEGDLALYQIWGLS
ncbi:MAG TPA: class I SAM-dependent methyltransferase [Brevefilum sp.]